MTVNPQILIAETNIRITGPVPMQPRKNGGIIIHFFVLKLKNFSIIFPCTSGRSRKTSFIFISRTSGSII